MAISISKIQAQAIISKLNREANNLRTQLIKDEKRNYTPSADYIKLAELIGERDRLKTLYESASDEAKKFADILSIKGFYSYIKADEALEKLRNQEIEAKYPKMDIGAVLDDLIIESAEDDFSVDNFIEHYLKQMRNG